jgi:hypothetical protein
MLPRTVEPSGHRLQYSRIGCFYFFYFLFFIFYYLTDSHIALYIIPLSECQNVFRPCRRRWLGGTILASLVLDSTGFCESQRGHLFFGISPRGEISQEGFAQGLVSPPATSRYIGSVRIISEAPLVCLNGC